VTFRFFEAEAAGGVGLRVEINEKRALAESGEARGEIDGCGCFAHAAFLVGDSDHLSRHARDCRAREKNINEERLRLLRRREGISMRAIANEEHRLLRSGNAKIGG
jgi:hypothetical protein